MIKKTKKVHEMEILRAFAIVLIVVYHSIVFLQIPYKALISWDYVANIGLSLFFFISGFLLYYNYKSLNFKNDLKTFYYKRTIRIYPLYWLALIFTLFSFIYVYGFISFPANQPTAILSPMSILSGILGLNALTEDNNGYNLSVFWFVSVILIYYVLYPFFTKPKNLINMFSVSLVLLLIFYFLSFKLNILSNLFIFYWIFFAGIVTCWFNDNYKTFKNVKTNFKDINYKKLFEYVLAGFLLILLSQTSFKNYWTQIIILLLITLIIYIIGRLLISYLTKNRNNFFKSVPYTIISKISQGSYAIYLFHLTIFGIIAYLITKFQLNSFQI